jgi:uncharacterized protein YjbJ (UPF0337 family)
MSEQDRNGALNGPSASFAGADGWINQRMTSTRRHRMTDRSDAGEARHGLTDSIAGKAKEVAGAIFGNDSLAREGQLQQAEGSERRTANAEEAVADAESAAAAQRLEADNDAARAARTAAATEEDRVVRGSEQVKKLEVATAEAAARVEKERAAVAAREHTDDVVDDATAEAAREHDRAAAQEDAAQREHDRLLAEASAADSAADRDQRAADRLAAEVAD